MAYVWWKNTRNLFAGRDLASLVAKARSKRESKSSNETHFLSKLHFSSYHHLLLRHESQVSVQCIRKYGVGRTIKPTLNLWRNYTLSRQKVLVKCNQSLGNFGGQFQYIKKYMNIYIKLTFCELQHKRLHLLLEICA